MADLIAAEPDGLPEERALDLIQEILERPQPRARARRPALRRQAGNVLVDAEQHALVTDFGIARDIGRSAKGIGTGRRNAGVHEPRADHGSDRVDHRADVFSAGVVLFEMLTGRLPLRNAKNCAIHSSTEPADIRDYREPRAAARGSSTRRCSAIRPSVGRAASRSRTRSSATADTDAGARPGCRDRDHRLPALAGAVASYEWKRMTEVRAEEERQALIKKQREAERKIQRDAERKTIDSLIVSAVKQLGFLCRESPRLESRQKALTTANQPASPIWSTVPHADRGHAQEHGRILEWLRQVHRSARDAQPGARHRSARRAPAR